MVAAVMSLMSTAAADPALPIDPHRLVGNWVLTAEHSENGVVRGYVVIQGSISPQHLAFNGYLDQDIEKRKKGMHSFYGYYHKQNSAADRSQGMFNSWYYYPHWRLRRSEDYNTLIGGSILSDGKDRTKLTRITPTVRSVRVTPLEPDALDHQQTRERWAKNQQVRITLEVRGEDLPVQPGMMIRSRCHDGWVSVMAREAT